MQVQESESHVERGEYVDIPECVFVFEVLIKVVDFITITAVACSKQLAIKTT